MGGLTEPLHLSSINLLRASEGEQDPFFLPPLVDERNCTSRLVPLGTPMLRAAQPMPTRNNYIPT